VKILTHKSNNPMKKLLLSSAIAAITIFNINAQDFSSFCATTSSSGILEGGKGAKTVTKEDGVFTATVDTIAGGQATFTWSIDQFWLGGTEITDSVFTLKVKSNFAASFRIGVLSDGFGKTYDVPFLSNKTLVADADYVEYSFAVSGPNGFNAKKFQQVIFYIVPTADVVAGKLMVKDFSYGKMGCMPSAVNAANNLLSNVSLFPNPATNEANVKVSLKSNGAVKVVVNHISGAAIYTSTEKVAAEVNEKINTSGWSKGVYAVTVTVDGVPTKTEMLVVQ
jgi:hypothetical protein